MINEVDEALRSLLKAEILNGADVEVVFDAPTREWASRRNKPTIDLYLYDIREDIRRRQTGYVERRNTDGEVEERQELPRFYKLAYLITAWTQRPEDEHRLLSALLACFMMQEIVPETYVPPALTDVGIPVALQIAYPPPENRQVSDVWSSLGGDLKASIDLVVTLPIRPQAMMELAQAVMAPLRLRTVSERTIDAYDGVRQLRDEGGMSGPHSEPGGEHPAVEPEVEPEKPARTRSSRGPGR
jgi:Pvc16 N-terminal domain